MRGLSKAFEQRILSMAELNLKRMMKLLKASLNPQHFHFAIKFAAPNLELSAFDFFAFQKCEISTPFVNSDLMDILILCTKLLEYKDSCTRS